MVRNLKEILINRIKSYTEYCFIKVACRVRETYLK